MDATKENVTLTSIAETKSQEGRAGQDEALCGKCTGNHLPNQLASPGPQLQSGEGGDSRNNIISSSSYASSFLFSQQEMRKPRWAAAEDVPGQLRLAMITPSHPRLISPGQQTSRLRVNWDSNHCITFFNECSAHNDVSNPHLGLRSFLQAWSPSAPHRNRRYHFITL